MNEIDFQAGIKDLKKIRLTEEEQVRMLDKIFATPIPSPYTKYLRVTVGVCLVVILSFSGVTYASGFSLPGDILYPIKTKVVEPVLNVINRAPEKAVAWAEEKVSRRLDEAEKLAKEDKLDDERTQTLDRAVEQSSVAFVQAVDVVASSTKEKADHLKQEFRKKIGGRNELVGGPLRQEAKKEDRVEKIRATAMKVLDDDNKSHGKGKNK